jgi:hypothetical protein
MDEGADRGCAAVDHEALTRDVRGQGRGQEDDGVRDLL